MKGMVFTRSIPATSKCTVFVIIDDNKILKFDCIETKEDILEGVRKLMLGISTAPEFTLITELPEGAAVSSTGPMAPSSLADLIKNQKLDMRTARTREDIIAEYSKIDIFDNARRAALRDEYIRTLTDTEQLAIWLHNKTCHMNHTEYCGFYHEVHGVEDDWAGYSHAQYLEKATNLLALTKGDVDLVKKVVEILES